MKFDFRLRRKFQRMKVQQVSFNGKRIGSESWTVPDVRDRIETFVAHARASDIDTIFRNKFLVSSQVNRRHSIFRTITAPASGSRQNAEGTRQQMPRAAHASGGKQLPDRKSVG